MSMWEYMNVSAVAYKGQKRAPDLHKLKLQVVVSCQMDAGN